MVCGDIVVIFQIGNCRRIVHKLAGLAVKLCVALLVEIIHPVHPVIELPGQIGLIQIFVEILLSGILAADAGDSALELLIHLSQNLIAEHHIVFRGKVLNAVYLLDLLLRIGGDKFGIGFRRILAPGVIPTHGQTVGRHGIDIVFHLGRVIAGPVKILVPAHITAIASSNDLIRLMACAHGIVIHSQCLNLSAAFLRLYNLAGLRLCFRFCFRFHIRGPVCIAYISHNTCKQNADRRENDNKFFHFLFPFLF